MIFLLSLSTLDWLVCRCTLNSNSTVVEWTRETTKNIELCKQQIKCAMSLRSYVEILFKQVVEDVSDRFSRTNEQFCKRMEEMRYAKMKLEGLHCGTANQVWNYHIHLDSWFNFKLCALRTAVMSINSPFVHAHTIDWRLPFKRR